MTRIKRDRFSLTKSQSRLENTLKPQTRTKNKGKNPTLFLSTDLMQLKEINYGNYFQCKKKCRVDVTRTEVFCQLTKNNTNTNL